MTSVGYPKKKKSIIITQILRKVDKRQLWRSVLYRCCMTMTKLEPKANIATLDCHWREVDFLMSFCENSSGMPKREKTCCCTERGIVKNNSPSQDRKKYCMSTHLWVSCLTKIFQQSVAAYAYERSTELQLQDKNAHSWVLQSRFPEKNRQFHAGLHPCENTRGMKRNIPPLSKN